MAAISGLSLAAAMALLMLGLGLWRQRPRPSAALSLCLGMLAGSVFFLHQAGLSWLHPLALLGPLAFNRALLAAFDERGRPWPVDLLLAAACLLLGSLWPRAFDLLALLIFAEAPLRIALGLGDDLVAWRRVGRTWFLGLGSALALLTALAALLGQAAWAAQAAAAATLLLCLAMAGRSWPVEPSRLQARLQAEVRPESVGDRLSEAELRQLARLQQRVRVEQGFRDPQMSLSRLARQLELPEHLVRRLVHLGEGQGHFSAYLNALRVAAIRAELADPARGAETVLSLALAAGYNSLSAFNRAFKASEGCTPSAFRAACQAQPSASTPNTAEIDSEA